MPTPIRAGPWLRLRLKIQPAALKAITPPSALRSSTSACSMAGASAMTSGPISSIPNEALPPTAITACDSARIPLASRTIPKTTPARIARNPPAVSTCSPAVAWTYPRSLKSPSAASRAKIPQLISSRPDSPTIPSTRTAWRPARSISRLPFLELENRKADYRLERSRARNISTGEAPSRWKRRPSGLREETA